ARPATRIRCGAPRRPSTARGAMNVQAPVLFPLAGRRVYVAGHRGVGGSALMRRLAREDCEVLTVDRAELDLRRQGDVESWMVAHRPDAVFVAAATAGGILANLTRPAR